MGTVSCNEMGRPLIPTVFAERLPCAYTEPRGGGCLDILQPLVAVVKASWKNDRGPEKCSADPGIEGSQRGSPQTRPATARGNACPSLHLENHGQMPSTKPALRMRMGFVRTGHSSPNSSHPPAGNVPAGQGSGLSAQRGGLTCALGRTR